MASSNGRHCCASSTPATTPIGASRPLLRPAVARDEVEKGPDLGGKVSSARIDTKELATELHLREDRLQFPIGEIRSDEPTRQDCEPHPLQGTEVEQGLVCALQNRIERDGLRTVRPFQRDPAIRDNDAI